MLIAKDTETRVLEAPALEFIPTTKTKDNIKLSSEEFTISSADVNFNASNCLDRPRLGKIIYLPGLLYIICVIVYGLVFYLSDMSDAVEQIFSHFLVKDGYYIDNIASIAALFFIVLLTSFIIVFSISPFSFKRLGFPFGISCLLIPSVFQIFFRFLQFFFQFGKDYTGIQTADVFLLKLIILTGASSMIIMPQLAMFYFDRGSVIFSHRFENSWVWFNFIVDIMYFVGYMSLICVDGLSLNMLHFLNALAIPSFCMRIFTSVWCFWHLLSDPTKSVNRTYSPICRGLLAISILYVIVPTISEALYRGYLAIYIDGGAELVYYDINRLYAHVFVMTVLNGLIPVGVGAVLLFCDDSSSNDTHPSVGEIQNWAQEFNSSILNGLEESGGLSSDEETSAVGSDYSDDSMDSKLSITVLCGHYRCVAARRIAEKLRANENEVFADLGGNIHFCREGVELVGIGPESLKLALIV